MFKFIPERRLFWFLKEGTPLDLSRSDTLDLYVQQVLSRGCWEDVKSLLKQVDPLRLQESFLRLKNFLPQEVRSFWEDWLGNYHPSSRNRS